MTEDSHVRDGIVRGWGHSEATVLQGSSWAHCSLTHEVRARWGLSSRQRLLLTTSDSLPGPEECA